MKFFVLVLDLNGCGIADRERERIQALPVRRQLFYQWDAFEGAELLSVWDGDEGDHIVASAQGGRVIAGQIRLDNRAEIASLVQADPRTVNDHDLVLRLVARYGARYIPELLGDFAFVAWDAASRSAIAACDAFSVRQLYHARHDGYVLFGSRADVLSTSDTYELAFLADVLTVNQAGRELTAYQGVKRLVPASIVTVRDHRVTSSKYWSAADFEPSIGARVTERAAIDMCRSLLAKSVQLRLEPDGNAWAQLSGGLDSSSVVSLAQWLVEQGTVKHGLAGTVTIVDGARTAADERVFSDQVVTRWQVRNELIVDAPIWYDTDCEVPIVPDRPTGVSPLDPRDRRLSTLVRRAGARVLLTGWGSDQLFTGDMMYLADQLARGQFTKTVREMAHIAALGRVSFWGFAYQNALLPFLPSALQEFAMRDMSRAPKWLRQDALRRLGITGKAMDARYKGRVGHKYAHFLATQVEYLDGSLDQPVLGETLDVRHPFLYRPLVEFALSLPATLCTRPHARKWILREAMRDILPEGVRTRVGKGGVSDMVLQTFARQPEFFAPLARDPILADLGLVDARELRAAIDLTTNNSNRKHGVHGDVLHTLAVEAWLQMRSGRWPHGVIRQHQVSTQFQSTATTVA